MDTLTARRHWQCAYPSPIESIFSRPVRHRLASDWKFRGRRLLAVRPMAVFEQLAVVIDVIVIVETALKARATPETFLSKEIQNAHDGRKLL